MVCVSGVQAAEGIFGQAVGGGPVQVAVPVDLDAHDASLEVESRESKLSSKPILEQDVSKIVRRASTQAYLNCHVLEAVPCIFHNFAKTL